MSIRDSQLRIYLQNLGIQVNELNKSKSIVFALADYLKMLTPSDCYDLSVRLVEGFKPNKNIMPLAQALQNIHKQQLLGGFLRISLSKKPSLMQYNSKTRTSAKFPPPQLQEISPTVHQISPTTDYKTHVQEVEDFRSPQRRESIHEGFYRIHQQLYNGEITNDEAQSQLLMLSDAYHTRSAQNRMNSCNSDSSVHDRLYEDGVKRQRRLYELQLKAKKDKEYSTYRPQSSVSKDKHTHNEVFKRLYSTQLIGKHDWKEIKDQIEMRECTFTPNQEKYASRNSSVRSAHDRLFKEADVRQKNLEHKQLMKQSLEIKDCTFKPQTSQKRDSTNRSMEKSDIYSRLYKENEDKQKFLELRRMEKERREVLSCTFKPKINEDARMQEQYLPVHERLYHFFEQKKQMEHQINQIREKSPLHEKSTNIQFHETSLIKRMKEFAERKKQNLANLEKQIIQDKGITFAPQINKRRQSRSNPRLDTSNISNQSARVPIPKIPYKPSPKLSSFISKRSTNESQFA